MAFTVEPSGAQIIDVSQAAKQAHHYGVKFEKKFVSTETVEKVIVFDPRRDKALQINANGQLYDIETTITPGEGNIDILDAAVPWVLLKNQITTDFQTGSGLENRNILAIRITSGVLTDDFEIAAIQSSLDERSS